MNDAIPMKQDAIPMKQETGTAVEHTRPGRTYTPQVEIRETEDVIWLWADLPGVDEQSVHVDLENEVLRIRGEVKVDDYADLTPVYTEYNVGSFERSFRLGTEIDADHIDARMRNGVLSLQLPKADEARPRQIPVAAA